MNNECFVMAICIFVTWRVYKGFSLLNSLLKGNLFFFFFLLFCSYLSSLLPFGTKQHLLLAHVYFEHAVFSILSNILYLLSIVFTRGAVVKVCSRFSEYSLLFDGIINVFLGACLLFQYPCLYFCPFYFTEKVHKVVNCLLVLHVLILLEK